MTTKQPGFAQARLKMAALMLEQKSCCCLRKGLIWTLFFGIKKKKKNKQNLGKGKDNVHHYVAIYKKIKPADTLFRFAKMASFNKMIN